MLNTGLATVLVTPSSPMGRGLAHGLALLAYSMLVAPSACTTALAGDATMAVDHHASASVSQNRPYLATTVLRVEGIQFVDTQRPAEQTALVDLTTHAQWQPHLGWEVQLGLNLFAERQQGGEANTWEVRGDYDESFVRYRSSMQRITLGAQRIRWGQMDYRSPTNRLAAYDRLRFPFSERGEQLPIPALRWEHFGQGVDTEWLWLPYFRASRLPDPDGVWYPVDRQRGLIAGIDLDPALAPWLALATIEDETPSGSGGVGIRLRGSTDQFDYALSAQRGRRSLPYYELDPESVLRLRPGLARGELKQEPRNTIAEEGAAFAEDLADGGELVRVRTRHPNATSLGGDMAWNWGETVWRAEAAWISAVPVTTTQLEYKTVPGLEWAVALETFPFDSEVRLIMQVSGDHRRNDRAILDATHAYALSGSVERYWNRQRWRTGLRYLLGHKPRQGYLNPQIAYLGHDAQEFFAEVHWFGGASETPIGFFRNHDLVLFGWRKHFR